MKGLILSGGKGTRLYPLTYTRAKQLIPVANKPVLFRVIEAIRDSGIRDIGIVTGDTGPEIQEAVGDGSQFGDVAITYIPQDAPLGLAHAVKIAYEQGFLDGERFVMFLGDNVIEGGINKLIADFENHPEWQSQIVLTEVERPQRYGVAKLRTDGNVEYLVEKPANPPTNLALVGIYMFDATIKEAVHTIKPSGRGELEITDAIQWLIDQGHTVAPHIHKGWWIDTGEPGEMLDANSYVLEEEIRNRTETVLGTIDDKSEVDARVIVEPGAEIIRSTIRGPVIIGQNSKIIDSYIGPFTSIYHNVLIEATEMERCMVLENSSVRRVPHLLRDSLIGRNADLDISDQRPYATKLTLGDFSKVRFTGNKGKI